MAFLGISVNKSFQKFYNFSFSFYLSVTKHIKVLVIMVKQSFRYSMPQSNDMEEYLKKYGMILDTLYVLQDRQCYIRW